MNTKLRNELRLLRRLAYRTLFRHGAYGAQNQRDVVDQFHRLYYDSHVFHGTWQDTYWLGVPTKKCPLDLWIYQEIIFSVRPDVIVECGTADGGSALFLASVCDLIGHGEVVTIDVAPRKQLPHHDRITYLHGSSTSDHIVAEVARRIEATADKRVMVFLDSDHRRDHVLAELRSYSGFVPAGSYIVVEDTNVNGHPVEADFGPGPMEAVDAFLAETDRFVVDESKQKFYLTFNPRGYLRRTA